MRGGHRSPNSWRYQVIKRYRRRALLFRERCKTIEEKFAWSAVIQWFDSILKNKGLNQYDVIVLPEVDLGELDKKFYESEFNAQWGRLRESLSSESK